MCRENDGEKEEMKCWVSSQSAPQSLQVESPEVAELSLTRNLHAFFSRPYYSQQEDGHKNYLSKLGADHQPLLPNAARASGE